MLDKKVEIIDEENFYYRMEGTIIEEALMAVLIKIEFTEFNQEVYFFKDQIKLIKN